MVKIPIALSDDILKETFLSDSFSEQDRYLALFLYFVSGFLYYRAPDLAHVHYPGASSCHGPAVDSMEGFTRFLPMIGAWISSGRDAFVLTTAGQNADLKELAKAGLVAGTDPNSSGYWGDIRDYDHRIVEAADVALSILLLGDSVWVLLTESQKEKIANWLLQVNDKQVHDNNWHLFPVLVNKVLRSLGYPNDQLNVDFHYERLKSFYRRNGWFSDGPNEIYDYYNAWGIHYTLFWIDLIDPDFDHDFINRSLNDFVKTYKYFFSTKGIPITGRSICYRMAAPSPLIAAAIKKLNNVSNGMAKRALDCVWRYFINKGAISRGNVTQGFWSDDFRFLDNYSGPGSGLWSLRSLVLAFYCQQDSDFWTCPQDKLPVEREDYDVFLPEIRWKIKGFKENQEVQIVKIDNIGNVPCKVKDYGFLRKSISFVCRRPFRPDNTYLKYDLEKYSSLYPFCCHGQL